jgi:hypothetical protein
VFECTAREADNLLPEWEDAVPYNSNDDRTCVQIFTKTKAGKHPASYLVSGSSRV